MARTNKTDVSLTRQSYDDAGLDDWRARQDFLRVFALGLEGEGSGPRGFPHLVSAIRDALSAVAGPRPARVYSLMCLHLYARDLDRRGDLLLSDLVRDLLHHASWGGWHLNHRVSLRRG